MKPRSVVRFVCVVVAGLGVPGTVVALLFVACAVTAKGTAAGMAGLAVTLAVWIEVFARRRAHDVIAGALVVVAAAVVVGLWASGPAASPTRAPPGLRSVWRDGPPTSSPFWLVPEVDQVCAGLGLAGLIDPIITVRDSLRYRAIVETQYRALEEDSGWAAVGPALPAMFSAAGDLHRFEVWPRPVGTPPRQALIFLHGSGGNFLPYAHLLQQVADQTQTLVILPSYGAGNWHNGGDAVVDAMWALARSRGLDRVFVAGLSNGGRGVTRAVRDHPGRFAGAAFVSAVVEGDVVAATGDLAGTAVLFVHGADDDRIPVDVVGPVVDAYAGKGAAVTRVVEPGEDHFFWFHRPARIAAALAAFLAAPPAAP